MSDHVSIDADNPYRPPESDAKISRRETAQARRWKVLARCYRRIQLAMGCLGLTILMNLASMNNRGLIEAIDRGELWSHALMLFGALIILLNFIFIPLALLAILSALREMGYTLFPILLFVILLFIPVANLLFLLMFYGVLRRELKEGGYRLGIYRARKLKEFQDDASAGWSSHGI